MTVNLLLTLAHCEIELLRTIREEGPTAQVRAKRAYLAAYAAAGGKKRKVAA